MAAGLVLPAGPAVLWLWGWLSLLLPWRELQHPIASPGCPQHGGTEERGLKCSQVRESQLGGLPGVLSAAWSRDRQGAGREWGRDRGRAGTGARSRARVRTRTRQGQDGQKRGGTGLQLLQEI